MPELSGAEWLAEAITRAGYSHIFLMPHNLFTTLVELDRRGVTCVLAHSEKAAAYMADGFARAAGRPGIVVTQGGPGATNLVAGLADAYQAHSPVVALTRSLDLESRYRDTYQDVISDFSHVTRFTADVLTTSQIPRLVNQAFREATVGAPRPAHLAILPAAERGRADLPDPLLDPTSTYVPSRRPQPDAGAIGEASDLLLAAERPVMIVGGGAIASRAWAEVLQLAELLEIPVATSLSGKGAIAETHPLAVGVAGVYGRSCANDVVREADLAFFVGVHPGSQLTCRWTSPPLATAAIQVDIDPGQLGKNHPLRAALAGDVQAALAQLAEEVGSRKRGSAAWLRTVHGRVDEWEREHAGRLGGDAELLRPEQVCAELTLSLPDDAVVVSDTGYASAWIGCFWRIDRSGLRFIRCEGSLGWAFPASIGVACALSDRPTVCFTGDGGLWYHLAELETMARLAIPVKTIVLDNSSLAFEAHILDEYFGGSGRVMTDHRPVDFAAVARDLGVAAERVHTADQLRSAIGRALEAPGPYLLDVVVDPAARAPVDGGIPLT